MRAVELVALEVGGLAAAEEEEARVDEVVGDLRRGRGRVRLRVRVRVRVRGRGRAKIRVRGLGLGG